MLDSVQPSFSCSRILLCTADIHDTMAALLPTKNYDDVILQTACKVPLPTSRPQAPMSASFGIGSKNDRPTTDCFDDLNVIRKDEGSFSPALDIAQECSGMHADLTKTFANVQHQNASTCSAEKPACKTSGHDANGTQDFFAEHPLPPKTAPKPQKRACRTALRNRHQRSRRSADLRWDRDPRTPRLLPCPSTPPAHSPSGSTTQTSKTSRTSAPALAPHPRRRQYLVRPQIVLAKCHRGLHA